MGYGAWRIQNGGGDHILGRVADPVQSLAAWLRVRDRNRRKRTSRHTTDLFLLSLWQQSWPTPGIAALLILERRAGQTLVSGLRE